jgi:hypothetical protein
MDPEVLGSTRPGLELNGIDGNDDLGVVWIIARVVGKA